MAADEGVNEKSQVKRSHGEEEIWVKCVLKIEKKKNKQEDVF